MDILERANMLARSGLSIIPILHNGSKAPPISWKEFQSTIADSDTLRRWFNVKSNYGIALVTGAVSGNLEVIDFDNLASYESWVELVRQQGQKNLIDKLPVVGTPSNGRHVPYRCKEGVEGNQKLAMRPLNDGSLETLIETRGEGGYALTVGCPPECHPLKKSYELLQGDLTTIPIINRAERHFLLQTAKALNEAIKTNKETKATNYQGSERPGDRFKKKETWDNILSPHTWVKVYQKGETTYWRRPGKPAPGISATTNHLGLDLLYVFSSNASPFEAYTGYTKFTAFALLNHNGHFSAAAAALASTGYGEDHHVYASEEHPWPDRADLPPLLPTAPALPLDMIPEPFQPWLSDVAERMSVQLESVAAPAICGLSMVVGRQIGIKPKRYDDWLVIPNLWGMDVDRPGMLKTAREKEGIKPVKWLADRATKEFEQQSPHIAAKREIHEAQTKNIRDKITKAIKESNLTLLPELEKDLAEFLLKGGGLDLKEPRYFTNDPTVEKLGVLLKENPRGMLLYRDELSGWMRSLDKHGREGDREFYLETWEGGGHHTVDRIGRGTIDTPALCLSVFGGIQPAKLEKLVSDAIQGGVGDDGMLQRFQLAVYPEKVEWANVDRVPNKEAKNCAYRIFESLDRLNPAEFGACIDETADIPYLHFSNEAQDLFDSWRSELEMRLRASDIGCEAFESHLAKYRSLMPSLALLFHLIDVSAGLIPPGPIPLAATKLAAAWCEFLEQHARKIYAVAMRPDLRAAHALADKISKNKIKDGDQIRNIYRNEWSFLQTKEVVYAGLAVLEECGWARVKSIETGGRPTDIVRLHPDLRGKSE